MITSVNPSGIAVAREPKLAHKEFFLNAIDFDGLPPGLGCFPGRDEFIRLLKERGEEVPEHYERTIVSWIPFPERFRLVVEFYE